MNFSRYNSKQIKLGLTAYFTLVSLISIILSIIIFK